MTKKNTQWQIFVINIFYIPSWTQMNINIKNIKMLIDEQYGKL